MMYLTAQLPRFAHCGISELIYCLSRTDTTCGRWWMNSRRPRYFTATITSPMERPSAALMEPSSRFVVSGWTAERLRTISSGMASEIVSAERRHLPLPLSGGGFCHSVAGHLSGAGV